MTRSNNDIAIEVQNKFAFYLVALVFTVLALSVETAKFGSSRISDGAELMAWVALLLSGLSGLRRLEIIPSIFRLGSLNVIGSEAKETMDKGIEKKQNSALYWYYAHKALFIFGLLCLLVARGYEPLIGLVGASC